MNVRPLLFATAHASAGARTRARARPATAASNVAVAVEARRESPSVEEWDKVGEECIKDLGRSTRLQQGVRGRQRAVSWMLRSHILFIILLINTVDVADAVAIRGSGT